MDAKAKEKTPGPLGVVGCLLAGFEVLGQNPWLLALPVLLDLFFWLGPHLSVVPLSQGVAAFFRDYPAPNPEAARQLAQMAQLAEQFGKQFNLFFLLNTVPILNVPSLLSQRAVAASPLGERDVLLVPNVAMLLAWAIVLIPTGMALGFLYLNGVARTVRAKWPQEEQASGQPSSLQTSSGVGKLIRTILFIVGILIIGIMFGPFWLFLFQAAVETAWLVLWILALGSGLIIGYIALHFLFVIPGVLAGGRGLLQAVWESIVMTHANLPPAMGLVLLILLIYEGLGYAWVLPTVDSWLVIVGILGNSCIATALVAAIFVFYQEHIGHLPRREQPVA